MEAYKHKENSGSTFLNDKEGNERRPDYKGSADIGGEDYYVAMWSKEYYHISFEKKSDAPF
jgi:hypothetical protein